MWDAKTWAATWLDLHNGCCKQCTQESRTVRLKPRRPGECIHLLANNSGWARSVVAHQLRTGLPPQTGCARVKYRCFFESIKLHDVEITSSRLCALLVRDSLFTASGTFQAVQLQKKHVVGICSRNFHHRIRVNLTPSLETRITTSLRLLCCVLSSRICSDVSRWWQMSNVCRKSCRPTRRNISKEEKSEDVSFDVAFTRSVLLV